MSRLLAVLFVAACGSSTFAQSPPQIVVAVAEKDQILLTVTKQVPVTKTFQVEVEVNGKKETQTRVATFFETVAEKQAVPLAQVKATDATGKAIPADRLKVLLAKEQLVIVSREGDIHEAYRKLFKDGVIFLQIEQPKK